MSERLYDSDSFLSTFAGAVTGVREMTGSGGGTVWQLALNRTAFYPTSGGQPFDTGTLHAANQPAPEIAVEEVEEDGQGTVWHFVREPLAVGTPVEGRIDWERRFDHMQQHTGQHLLSAVFLRELHLPTVSFHLGASASTIDLAGASLAHHSLERVERIANEIAGEDRPVTSRHVSRAEAEAMLAAGELRKLPDREGAIRLIEIAGCDRNACGGTHVRSTGQIGGLLVRRVEKVTRGLRVEFVCGMRAVRTARADAAVLNETAALLSVGAAELPAAVARLQSEARAGAKERQKLREELTIFQAAELAAETPLENSFRLVVRAWKNRDRDEVRLLASRTAAAAPRTAVFFSAQDADPVRILIARSADLPFDCGLILREALAQLGRRGGGTPDLAQGEVPAAQEAALRDAVTTAMRNAAADAQPAH
ncbi:MAG: alanyl-tRNA editing protein [Acidobacteriota bacterium]